MKWWDQLVSANSPADFLVALAVALAVWIALALLKRYGGQALVQIARRTAAGWDDLLGESVRATSLPLLLLFVDWDWLARCARELLARARGA